MTNSLKILLLAIIPLMLTLPVLAHAQDAPNDGDQVNSSKIDDTRSNEDWQEYLYHIGSTILDLQLENQQLAKLSNNNTIQNMIRDNNNRIDRLHAELDELILELPVVEDPESDDPRMIAIILKLALSDLPLLGMGVDTSTGMLDIVIDIDRATPDIEQQIQNIAIGVILNFEYAENTARFQSGSCDRSA